MGKFPLAPFYPPLFGPRPGKLEEETQFPTARQRMAALAAGRHPLECGVARPSTALAHSGRDPQDALGACGGKGKAGSERSTQVFDILGPPRILPNTTLPPPTCFMLVFVEGTAWMIMILPVRSTIWAPAHRQRIGGWRCAVERIVNRICHIVQKKQEARERVYGACMLSHST